MDELNSLKGWVCILQYFTDISRVGASRLAARYIFIFALVEALTKAYKLAATTGQKTTKGHGKRLACHSNLSPPQMNEAL
jgi:hypothetical protein